MRLQVWLKFKKIELFNNKNIDGTLKPDTGDYYYYCRPCNKVKDDLRSVLAHCKLAHNVKRIPGCIMRIDLEPNIYISQNYCQTSELKSLPAERYRCHLRRIYGMILKPLKNKKI